MIEKEKQENRWSKIGWNLIVIWFCANLLSQALFIGLNGTPYDAHLMLASLGSFAFYLVIIEVGVWVCILVVVLLKISQRLRVPTKENLSIEKMRPQT